MGSGVSSFESGKWRFVDNGEWRVDNGEWIKELGIGE